MILKKTGNFAVSSLPEGSEFVFVVLEPLPGYRDEEIVASLEEAGVDEINVLAPGYISVRATPEALKTVEEIADIHIKPRKQLRVSAKRSAIGKHV